MPPTSSTVSSRSWRVVSDAEAHRHQVRDGHRLRPDRHRPGLRVRLLRHPGVPRAEGRGPAGHPGQLQPGHDHDRPGVRRRDLRRADHPGVRREGHRQGASRRAAAHPRWPDRAQRRDEPPRRRHPGEVRRRADRCLGGGDREGREPRAVQADRRGPAARVGCRGRAQRDLQRRGPRPGCPQGGEGRRGAGEGARRSRGPRLPGRRPPVVHHGRRGFRPGLRRGRAAPHRRPGPDRQPDHRGAPGGVDPRLEGVRAGGDARQGRQRRHRLLDRERRPARRAHR